MSSEGACVTNHICAREKNDDIGDRALSLSKEEGTLNPVSRLLEMSLSLTFHQRRLFQILIRI